MHGKRTPGNHIDILRFDVLNMEDFSWLATAGEWLAERMASMPRAAPRMPDSAPVNGGQIDSVDATGYEPTTCNMARAPVAWTDLATR